MARLCPSINCTEVCARRTVKLGRTAVWPPIVVNGEPVCESSDTSGVTFR